MSKFAFGDPSMLADAIELANSFKKAKGPAKGSKNRSYAAQQYQPPPPRRQAHPSGGVVRPGSLSVASQPSVATSSSATSSRASRPLNTQAWVTRGGLPTLTGGAALEFLRRQDVKTTGTKAANVEAKPSKGDTGNVQVNSGPISKQPNVLRAETKEGVAIPNAEGAIAARDVAASKLLETYHQLISESTADPSAVQTCQVDALIDRMEQFNLRSAALEGAQVQEKALRPIDHAQRVDIASIGQPKTTSPTEPAGDSCTCKPATKTPKGLSSSRFATEKETSSHDGKFTLRVGVKVHGPRCPLFNPSKDASGRLKENQPPAR